ELGYFYERYVSGEEGAEEIAELEVQYGDYAEWQRGWMREEVVEEEVRYWKEVLEGMAALEMPVDRVRPSVQSFRGAAQVWKLPLAETERLSALCQREGVTMFMALMTAFQILLHYLTGQVDIVVGTDIANRNHRQLEGLIGFFVNQLVLRLDLSGDPTLRELLERARTNTLEAYAHQDVPFEMLVAELQPERELNRTPMFQVKLVLQNYPLDSLEMAGLILTPIPVPIHTSKYDLLFNIYETGQGLAATLEYDTDLFDAASISRFLSHYEAILRQAVEDPAVRLKRMVERLAQADERQRALKEERLAEVSMRKLREIKRRPVAES
ncbi:MAG TPA: condensation domain-containing protein, partial [Pyrinomonadaceae bacterium]